MVAGDLGELIACLRGNTSLKVSVKNIKCLVEKCKSLDPKSVAFRDDTQYFSLLSGFINRLTECYTVLSIREDNSMNDHALTQKVNEEPSTIMNQLFAAQCWLCSVLKNNLSKVEFLKFNVVGHTSKELIKLAKVADSLGASFSLPVWKFASSIMKQYKCEVRNYVHEISKGKGDSARRGIESLFGDILKSIVDSLHYYYDKCSRPYSNEMETKKINVKDTENSIQMLNLLSRIFTFCIREFTKEILTSDIDSEARVIFADWLLWMINVSYAGGSYPIGHDFPASVAEELSSSFFLSVDVVLSHVVTLHPSYESQENCSLFVQLISRPGFDAPVTCRIYGKILGNLARHPNSYSRWMNDNFNLYTELFNACGKIDLSLPGKKDGTKNQEYPYSGEFYITILQQISASVCGLSMACFPFLETALLPSVLSEHPFVHLLAMDVWCFVARYGTSDLCLHYVTLLTSIVNKVARKIQMENCVNESHSLSLMSMVSRLSHLLSRLIVFLTPKQQSVYLHQNSLKYVNLNSASDSISSLSNSLIWYYAPTPTSRLQKVSCNIIEQQVTERLLHLDNLIDINSISANSSQTTYLLTEVCLCLRLINCLSERQRRSSLCIIGKGIHFLLKCHQIDIPVVNNLFPYSTFLKSWTSQPISVLLVCISSWFPKVCSNSLSDPNPRPETEILDDLIKLSFLSNVTLPVLPECFFSILNAWNSLFNFSITHRYLKTWFQELKSNIDQLQSRITSDHFCADLLKSLQKKLDSVSLIKPTISTPELTKMLPSCSHNDEDEISNCLRDMSSALNRLKSVWPPKGPNKSIQFNEARNILKHFSDFMCTS
ncbi:unnamed protein product [Heterobilharzia americana]|nr:unnamed protein product [Heterobilharzia americana]